MSPTGAATTADVREYWDHHIHDLEISSHAPGTPGFFADLDQYGEDGVRFWTRSKKVTQRWPKGGIDAGAAFVIPTMR